ncbi:shikimate kinase [Archaeoglobus fulgidus]|nr:shikimate kinase [Archaeoglobus fulgidus]
MRAKAYAAGTVLNALPTGIGSAFGIEMHTIVKLRPSDELKVFVNGVERRSIVAERILNSMDVTAEVIVESEIPGGSGLGSSSAFVNALICAVKKMKGEELNAFEILRSNARFSLEAGISYTGAFDDASASMLGGFVVSDNRKMRLIRTDEFEGYSAVLIPKFSRGKVDWRRLRERASEVEGAVEAAMRGEYCKAMKLNTEYICKMLGYPLEIAEKGWEKGICCGISGNGPSYVAFGSKNEMEALAETWGEYGRVYVRRVADEPAEDVVIPTPFFRKLDG